MHNFYEPNVYQPFTIAIYSGSSKPKNIDDYFPDFIKELNRLQDEGVVIVQGHNRAWWL